MRLLERTTLPTARGHIVRARVQLDEFPAVVTVVRAEDGVWRPVAVEVAGDDRKHVIGFAKRQVLPDDMVARLEHGQVEQVAA